MKYILLLALCIANLNICYSQEQIGAAKKTEVHINIPGTKIWLIPPIGFVISDKFKGLSNPEDKTSMLMITEMPASVYKVSEGFKQLRKLPNGMEITSTKSYNMAGQSEALFVNVSQPSQGLMFDKQMLLFGDEKTSTMIVAVYLKDSVKTGLKMEQSIRSVYYDAQQVIDARSNIGYTLDERGTAFKYSYVMGTNISFDAKSTTGNPADSISFGASKAFSDLNTQNKKQFCIARAKKMPYKEINIDLKRGLTEVEIDGLKGYELYATTIDSKNLTEQFYQLILFTDKSYYIIVATCQHPSAENIAAIRDFARTFKQK
jgi:Rieske Fe-S protein